MIELNLPTFKNSKIKKMLETNFHKNYNILWLGLRPALRTPAPSVLRAFAISGYLGFSGMALSFAFRGGEMNFGFNLIL